MRHKDDKKYNLKCDSRDMSSFLLGCTYRSSMQICQQKAEELYCTKIEENKNDISRNIFKN